METQEIRHTNVGGKFKIVIERTATAKGTIGYKVEANDDTLDGAVFSARYLREQAEVIAGLPVTDEKTKP